MLDKILAHEDEVKFRAFLPFLWHVALDPFVDTAHRVRLVEAPDDWAPGGTAELDACGDLGFGNGGFCVGRVRGDRGGERVCCCCGVFLRRRGGGR